MIESVPAVEIGPTTRAADAPLEILFDQQCPLCRREVRWLRSHSTASQLAFTDISSADFDLASTGRSLEELMGNLHARTAAGEWLVGMDAIRGMYRGAGFGRYVGVTEWTVLNRIFNLAYRAFAIARPYLRRASPNTDACTERCSPRKFEG